MSPSITGIVAKKDIREGKGTVRNGVWRVRVPVQHLDAFCNEVLLLGEAVQNAQDSQDVTEEYFDLENHLKTQQAELESLRKLMGQVVEKTEKLNALLEVRREINRVQDDLNRTQGRLKLLANLSDLTTVNLTIREKQPYVQEKVETKEKVDFATKVSVTFHDSLEALKEFGEGLALILIAITPWLPVVLVAAVPVWWLSRRCCRGRDVKAVVEESPAPPNAG